MSKIEFELDDFEHYLDENNITDEQVHEQLEALKNNLQKPVHVDDVAGFFNENYGVLETSLFIQHLHEYLKQEGEL